MVQIQGHYLSVTILEATKFTEPLDSLSGAGKLTTFCIYLSFIFEDSSFKVQKPICVS